MKNPCDKKPMGFFCFFHFSSFIFLSGPKTGKSIFLHNEHLYLTRKGFLRFFLIFGDVFSPNFFSLFQKSVSGKTPVFFRNPCFFFHVRKNMGWRKKSKKMVGSGPTQKKFWPHIRLWHGLGGLKIIFGELLGRPLPPLFGHPWWCQEKHGMFFLLSRPWRTWGRGGVPFWDPLR